MKLSPIICTPSGFGITSKMSLSWQLVSFDINSDGDGRMVLIFLFAWLAFLNCLKRPIDKTTERLCTEIDSTCHGLS